MIARLANWLYWRWFGDGQAYRGYWHWEVAELLKRLSRSIWMAKGGE